MFRLTNIRDAERGAVAMIVAMLFGFGVMIGLAALTIDVGNINADRRQLQNGADAVALAVAQQCATTDTCDPTATNLGDLANANAADKATAIKRVDNQLPLLAPTTDPPYPAICGKAGNATGLLECDPAWIQSMSNLQECPLTPSSGKYVRVYAETKNSAGGNLLPYSFGAAIAGVGSGANQQACATVAWGTLSTATVFPFAFSACEWTVATTGGTKDPPDVQPTYPLGPPYVGTSTAQASWQKAIVLNDKTATTLCEDWQGHDLPGGFGWVTTPSCNVTLSVGDWIGIDEGMGKGNDCATDITQSVHKIINIPVYDCIDDSQKRTPCVDQSVNPSSAFYHIKGFASFYMTGIEVTGQISIAPDFPPSTAKDPTPSEACGGGKCIFGWFLKDLIPVGGDLGGSQDFGTTFMKLVG